MFQLQVCALLSINRIRRNRDPSHTDVKYTALESTLRIQHNLSINESVDNAQAWAFPDRAAHQQIVGPLIYARALFHLSGCLLHHPFLLQQRIFDHTSRVPPYFLDKAWTSSRAHAKALSRLQDEQAHGCVTVSTFRGYCTMVAGSIHLLYMCDKMEAVQRLSLQHYNDGLKFLQGLSRYWKCFG